MASTVQVLVPDIGGFNDVDVIDVLVKPGQQIDKETPMITLETEKAAMDVPAPAAGRIAEVKVKKGDKVSQGSLILLLESTATLEGGAENAAPPAAAGKGTPPAPASPGEDSPAAVSKVAAPAKPAASQADRAPEQPPPAASPPPAARAPGSGGNR